MRIIAQIWLIRAWKMKHKGYWHFFDAGNLKSQDMCNFQGRDWKFKHLYWKNEK